MKGGIHSEHAQNTCGEPKERSTEAGRDVASQEAYGINRDRVRPGVVVRSVIKKTRVWRLPSRAEDVHEELEQDSRTKLHAGGREKWLRIVGGEDLEP